MSSGTRLFVGNLPGDVQNLEQSLSEEFSAYGAVQQVEVKVKKDVEGRQVGQFAFVTLQADRGTVQQCIQEFSEQEWKGKYLNVSVAKESFLERLKRERAENDMKKGTQPDSTDITTNGHIEKINIKIPEKKTTADYESRKEIYTQNNNKINKQKPIFVETFNVEKVSEVNINDISIEKKEPKRPKRPKNRVKNIAGPDVAQSDDVQQKEVKKLTPADQKRLQSMQNMRTAYNEKKSLIKMALSSVDKKVNKIVFDEYGEQVQTSISQEEGSLETGGSTGKRKRHKDDFRNDNTTASGKKIKTSLFDDEDLEENDEITFEVKEHFQGEAGQKLMQLQSKYKSDKRFVLDERFIENGSGDTSKRQDIGKDTENYDLEVEEDGEAEQGDVDAVRDDEKRKEIEILESILGTSVKTSNRIRADNEDGRKQIPIKTMLRYDPSRPDHDKFVTKPQEKPEGSKKKSKKEKKEEMEKKLQEEQLKEQKPAPKVSQERYYKVNQSLKQVMQTEDEQPFSLLSMFGKVSSEDADKTANTEESYKTETIVERIDKVKNPLKDSNPFKYDSDTDEEKEGKLAKQTTSNGESLTNFDEAPLIVQINENFFFTLDDSRLKDGVKFFLETKSTGDRSRKELKNLVNKRIKNNMRNEAHHQSKVQKQSQAPQRRQPGGHSRGGGARKHHSGTFR